MKRFRWTALAPLVLTIALSSCGSDVGVATESTSPGTTEVSEAIGCGSGTSLPNKFQFVPNFEEAVAEPAPSDAIPTVPVEQALATVTEDYFVGRAVTPRLVVLTVPPTQGHDDTAIDHRLTWALAYPFAEPQEMDIYGPPGISRVTDCIADEQIVYVDATQPQDTWIFGATEYHHTTNPPT